ncbi:MAG: hypothetical protein R3A80_07235 [Bdellovibrionota bacterium]
MISVRYTKTMLLAAALLTTNIWASGAKAPSSPSDGGNGSSNSDAKLKFGSFSDLFKTSKFNGTKSVTSTIVINKAGVYDFKNVLHIWKGKSWSCTAEKENGPQILRIEASDVTVKNFAYIGDGKTHGSKGLGDPIHVASCGSGQGNLCSKKGPKNVVLDNIYGHACEDMITIGTPGGSNITIKDSVLIATPSKSKWDKTIQVNFGKDIKIYDNVFVGGERCVRFKPNTSGEVVDNTFNGCNTAVQMSAKDKDIKPMTNGPSEAYL